LSYRPFINNEIESEIPYLCSSDKHDKDSLMEQVDKIINTNEYKYKDLKILDKYIDKSREFVGSTDQIINHFVNLSSKIKLSKSLYQKDNFHLLKLLKKYIKKIIHREGYINHKFKDVNIESITSKVKDISKVLDLETDNISIKELAEDIFLIEEL